MAVFPMAQFFADLGIPGSDLLLRNFGRRALPTLEQALRQVAAGHALELDFQGVSVMDTSFADETVLELALGLAGARFGDRYLILRQPSPATVDNLEGTLARRKAKIGLLCRTDAGTRVIGHVESNLLEAWDLALHLGTLTARTLADNLGLEINTASTRLLKLNHARLLARHEETTHAGRQHVYEVPQ